MATTQREMPPLFRPIIGQDLPCRRRFEKGLPNFDRFAPPSNRVPIGVSQIQDTTEFRGKIARDLIPILLQALNCCAVFGGQGYSLVFDLSRLARDTVHFLERAFIL